MIVLQPVPLFPGLPGGIELLIVLLIQLLIFGVLVALAAVGAAKLLKRGGSDDADERIAELEQKVDRLEREREN
jgi:hypothetical protein